MTATPGMLALNEELVAAIVRAEDAGTSTQEILAKLGTIMASIVGSTAPDEAALRDSIAAMQRGIDLQARTSFMLQRANAPGGRT